MISVLFAQENSIYKTLPDCDVWDKQRDASKYQGPNPVVAHPPCRAWSQLRGLANPEPGEKELAIFAIDTVRKYGGVLEHPKSSSLWPVVGLPEPGEMDEFGGWTLQVIQRDFGHKANKATRLYIVGCEINNIPAIPFALGEAEYVCGAARRRKDGTRLLKGAAGWRPEVTKSEREGTPINFAVWLIELAKNCAGP